VGCCEHSNKSLGGEFSDQLNNSQLFKDYVLWS